MANTFRNIRDGGNLIVPNVGALPATAITGTLAVDASTSDIYVFDGSAWQLKTASGSAGVTSFNTRTGVVTSVSGDYSASQVTNTPSGNISATDVQAAIDELDTEKQEIISGADNSFIIKNNLGVVESSSSVTVNSLDGISTSNTLNPNNISGSYLLHTLNTIVNPIANSPNDSVIIHNEQVQIDTDSDGFSLGTSGNALHFTVQNITHTGKSDVGQIILNSNNFSVGNGTDPITLNGFGYEFGLGQINANVDILNSMQGYGYQPNINAAATISSTTFTQAFYDNAVYNCSSPNYTSVNASPTIEDILNNNNFNGLNINPTINTFSGNSGFNGIAISSNLGTFDTGSFNGININPTIDFVNSAYGLTVNMSNVTVNPGMAASLVIQDLTITSSGVGSSANSVTFEYTSGGTAGSEIVSGAFPTYSVQIENGVSTATQIKAALDAYGPLVGQITVTISGVGSNTQVTQAATNLSGGIDSGNKKAALFSGDVEISGSLQFGGALSIGKLSAFATQAVADNGGQPATIHSLVSSPTVAANATIANADTLGINTAMLLDIGDNATVTSSFTGISALALPAVITMGAGSTLDKAAGATFALSLASGAGGGTIDSLDLCRAIAIPNGSTVITKLVGYKMDLPFGDPGTTSWGLYVTPTAHNYMAGDLLIGGTPGSSDTPTNSSVGLEIQSTTKSFLNARMTTTERNALTAVDGMQIYNTTDSKLQVYSSGIWVDLH